MEGEGGTVRMIKEEGRSKRELEKMGELVSRGEERERRKSTRTCSIRRGEK